MRVGDLIAVSVDELQGRSVGRDMAVAPLPHRGDDGPEIAAFGRELVIKARRML